MTESELNSTYGEFLASMVEPFRIDFSNNKGITVVPKNNFGAIELDAPACSNIELSKTQSGQIVVRYCFGSNFAVKTFKDYKQGIRFLSIVQNEMLLAISPWIDWTSSPKVYFQSPGQPHRFFRELQSHAGFELRAYYDGQS